MKDIFITIGRTGKATPNAYLEPVKLAGTTVSYASLHNQDMIIDKDIRINDYVYVRKAGDIIPEVVRVELSKRNNQVLPYQFPSTCPNCQGILHRYPNEANHYCINIDCPSRVCESIAHFASRDALNIEGLGISIVNQLYSEKILTKIEDIYLLKDKEAEILKLKRMGLKSYTNLINAIENSKKHSLDKILYGLGIRQVGEKTAKILAKHFKDIDQIICADIHELEAIEDIGVITAKIIYDYFRNPLNLKVIDFLKTQNLNLTYQENINTNKVFENQKIVLTGTLVNYDRKAMSALLEAFGAKVVSSVSKNTDYVIYGSMAGSKLDKAKQLGIKCISEEELMTLIQGK